MKSAHVHTAVQLSALCATPVFTHAATFKTIVDGTVLPLLDSAVGLIVTVAVLAFVFGLVRYLYGAGDDKKSEAKQTMLWGVIAMFVIVSVWGLVRIIHVTFFG